MADVTVEFGAKDAGLSQTLKNVQKELADLDTQQKKTAMSADEFQRSLSRTKQLEGMEKKLRSMSSEADKSSLSLGKIGLAAGVAGVAVKAGMMAMETATAAARAVVDGFAQAIDLGGKLNDLSSRTGETAGNLLVLQRAFENSGLGADKVGQSLNKLQKFMAEANAGGVEQTQTLDALGISMSDLAGKTPSEQMQVLAQKIASISDPAERARASMDIFGKAGGELLPLLNNFSGEIDTARGQLGSMPSAMDRSAKAMDDLGDSMKAISSKSMEFAAGFIEKALPALNMFTNALSGVDAAGWGQALMKQVMNVADFLIGAFKAPMPAIEAIGLALLAGVKQAGNNYLNSLIDAGNFLKSFFSSDLPRLIAGQIGIALIKTVIDFSKFFVDNINSVVKGFEEFFGKAIENVITFFSNSFNKVVNAFASDFKNAMSDPIGFVTGKFNSALAFVSENGAMAFKTAFDAAGGSVLDKISSGLGAASDMYGERLKTNTAKLTNEFKKVVDSFEKSDIDIFGAKESSAAAAEKFKEVEVIGTKIRTDFEKSAQSAEKIEKNTSGAADDANAIAGSFGKAEGATSRMKENLSTSASLLKGIAQAESQQGVDPGGKLQQKAQQQVQKNQFSAAKRTAEQIQRNELESSLRYGGDSKFQDTTGKDRRSIVDIGKQYGVRQNGDSTSEFMERIKRVKEGLDTVDKFGRNIREGEKISREDPFAKYKDLKTGKELTKEQKDAMKREEKNKELKDQFGKDAKAKMDQPGKDGQKEDGQKEQKEDKITNLVEKIEKLVQKIEKKLPQQALAY